MGDFSFPALLPLKLIDTRLQSSNLHGKGPPSEAILWLRHEIYHEAKILDSHT